MIGDYLITIVDAGTVVGQDANGGDMMVTDNSAVYNDKRMWITQKVYDALKAKSVPRSFKEGEE